MHTREGAEASGSKQASYIAYGLVKCGNRSCTRFWPVLLVSNSACPVGTNSFYCWYQIPFIVWIKFLLFGLSRWYQTLLYGTCMERLPVKARALIYIYICAYLALSLGMLCNQRTWACNVNTTRIKDLAACIAYRNFWFCKLSYSLCTQTCFARFLLFAHSGGHHHRCGHASPSPRASSFAWAFHWPQFWLRNKRRAMADAGCPVHWLIAGSPWYAEHHVRTEQRLQA